MHTLPTRLAPFILPFAPLFRQRTWRHAQALLLGAMLVPGRRTVTSVLRGLGRARDRHFCNAHRVLSRAAWSPRAAARVLVGLVLRYLAPRGPVVLGVDDTLERRRGRRIAATRIYRDPVRSSRAHTAPTSALRWLSVMMLVRVPWARRVWALPVFTALAPSAPACGPRRPKPLAAWARQMVRQVARWVDALAPGRPMTLVADASFAALELLHALAPRVTCITRLRLDAGLYRPPPPRPPGRPGRPRVKGARGPILARLAVDPTTPWQRVTVPAWYGTGPRALEVVSDTAWWYSAGRPVVPLRWVLVRDPAGRFRPQALLCTDQALAPVSIIETYLQRWQVEVTFEEARRHLGVETQRQWSDRAIARATPILLGLFTLVTLCAGALARGGTLPLPPTAWYRKAAPTFSDALGAVRCEVWLSIFAPALRTADARKSRRYLFRRFIEPLLDAA